VFGFRWHYYACMDGDVYNITEWASCQVGAVSYVWTQATYWRPEWAEPEGRPEMISSQPDCLFVSWLVTEVREYSCSPVRAPGQ